MHESCLGIEPRDVHPAGNLGRKTQAAGGSSDVSILHGVPGLTVDVYANGNKRLSDFKPGTLTDPVKLAAGTYDLAAFPAGRGPSGTPAIQAKGVIVPAGATLSGQFLRGLAD